MTGSTIIMTQPSYLGLLVCFHLLQGPMWDRPTPSLLDLPPSEWGTMDQGLIQHALTSPSILQTPENTMISGSFCKYTDSQKGVHVTPLVKILCIKDTPQYLL